jgi:hypothetical protein
MSIETLSDVPLFAARPPRQAVPQRKAASWIVAGFVHVLIFAMFLTASRFDDYVQHGSEHETMLDLPGAQDSTRQEVKQVAPQAPLGVPPEIRTLPVAPPPVIEQAPLIQPEGGQERGDVLGALGREIACSPGHYENLTEAQRARCVHIPWQGAMAPNGVIVLNRPEGVNRFAPPPPEYHVTGQDAQRLSVERAPTDCSFGLNMPCANKIPGR